MIYACNRRSTAPAVKMSNFLLNLFLEEIVRVCTHYYADGHAFGRDQPLVPAGVGCGITAQLITGIVSLPH